MAETVIFFLYFFQDGYTIKKKLVVHTAFDEMACEECGKEWLLTMRKKSHISLARYIVEHTKDEELKKHKLSFYIGSVLPDCLPSFIYKRHEITGTFPQVRKRMERLIKGKKKRALKRKRRYYMHLGEITHYVADYFTYPHNHVYPGNMKDHCKYENRLKHELRQFLKTEEADKLAGQRHEQFVSLEALVDYIRQKHEEYLHSPLNTRHDILNIVQVNQRLVDGISDLFQKNRMQHRLA